MMAGAKESSFNALILHPPYILALSSALSPSFRALVTATTTSAGQQWTSLSLRSLRETPAGQAQLPPSYPISVPYGGPDVTDTTPRSQSTNNNTITYNLNGQPDDQSHEITYFIAIFQTHTTSGSQSNSGGCGDEAVSVWGDLSVGPGLPSTLNPQASRYMVALSQRLVCPPPSWS